MRVLAGSCLLTLTLLTACDGDDDSANGEPPAPTGGGTVTVSGGTVYHSINRLATELSGTTPEYSELTVGIVAFEALRAEPDAPTLAETPQPDGCATTGSCNWSHGAVDLTSAADGLVAVLADERSEPIWVTTFTRFLDGAGLAAAKDAGQTSAGRAFAVSREGVDLVLAPMTDFDADELVERGFVFGLVYDAMGRPISGATVTADDADFTIVYPNDRFTGVADATTMQGAFLAIGPSGGATEAAFTVTAPAGSELAWDESEVALVVPRGIYFALLYANP